MERLLVASLADTRLDRVWTGPRARLCEQMLDHNLHQLHLAADDLRSTAYRFRRRADEVDAAHRRGA
jgi:hypothetical protein